MNILGLIPARGGSKGIPHKNIVPLAGKPLIAYTIEAALQSNILDRVIVSTDDEQIASIARDYGADVPFLRPTQFSGDTAPALAVMQHAITTLEQQDNWIADVVVYLQPTSPLRQAQHISESFTLYKTKQAKTVVSVSEVPHHHNPYSVLTVTDHKVTPFIEQDHAILRRQDKPKVYARNGPAVLILSKDRIMTEKALYGEDTYAYEMDHVSSVDIDTPFDLKFAEWLLAHRTTDAY